MALLSVSLQLLALLSATNFEPKEDSTIAGLLHREDVQAKIKMTPSQIKKLKEIDPLPKFKNSGTFEPDKIEIVDPQVEANKEESREKKVWLLLSPDQVGRVFELHVQKNGVRTLTRFDVQAHLQITDAQKDSIRLVVASRQFELRSLIKLQQSKGLERDRIDPKRLENKLQAIEKKYEQGLRDVLTLDQVNALEALGGKKFTFATRTYK